MKHRAESNDDASVGDSETAATEKEQVRMEVGEPVADVAAMFGERVDLARRYHRWLGDVATVRGLIGPREVPRLWSRHILNSAVVGEAIPEGSTVADIGSGAGLPGIPLAIARPDVSVTLIEPLLRRTTFLEEVVADLGLGNVTVVRGRAEEKAVKKAVGTFDIVTSRAVAPLGRLAGWSLPLVKPGGLMVALKGASAPEEIARDAKEIRKAKGVDPESVEIGIDAGYPTHVVRIRRA